ncbi:aminotransferase [Bacillaceae bacterium JMAK1]|nr:aminotransferase [Bacillaceae bacterium JMAK1]
MGDKTVVSNEEMVEKDRRLLWHHMTPYQENSGAMIVDKAKGAWIEDLDGNRFLDAMAGLWCVNAGYGREELAEAAFEQLKKMPFYPLTQSHLPAIRLADKLNEWLGEEYRFSFSNSGSEANETAFKIARQYHYQNGDQGRYKVISRYRAYHGTTLGALSATGQPQRKYRYEPLVPGFTHVTAPDSYRVPEEHTEESWSKHCAHEIEQTIRWERPETVAAVIMEPIITGGGVLMPHPSYLKEVESICKKYGVLLIIDEVICGFGRTGKPFTFQHYDISPDIVTMAKGITSAYLPLSATAMKPYLFEVFKETGENDHFRHVNTFGGHPAACEVAVKNLEIMEEESLVEQSSVQGKKLRSQLEPLLRHPLVGDIRQKGLLLGIELVEDKKTKVPAAPEVIADLMKRCKQKGLIVGKNSDTVSGYQNVIALSPPLSITDEDVTFIASTLKQVFSIQ